MLHKLRKEESMQEFLCEIGLSIKNLFQEKSNIIILLLVVILCCNIYGFTKLKKKIDHRYFNMTTTLEEIYNIKINTLNGELKK